MQDDLFSELAEYTIDSCSLMDIFNDTPWMSKKVNPGLWEKVSELIEKGIIISHIEALEEIKKDGDKGEELFDWAHAHKHIFKPHDPILEGTIIREMSKKYSDFTGRKVEPPYADPWLIAQAKIHRLKIITQEKRSNSPNLKNFMIPNICGDDDFKVSCLNLWDLTVERGWSFKVI